MHPHLQFIGNVLAHLVASMSGLVSFGIAVYEAFHKKRFETWAFFTIGALCLIVAFDQAWQDEHRNGKAWEQQRNAAYQEKDFWKDQSYQKDAAILSRDNLLAKNYAALIGEQATANQTQQSLAQLSGKIIDLTKPEPQKVTIRRDDSDPSTFAKWTHLTQFVLIPNRPIGVHVFLKCEQPIEMVEAHIIEGGPRFPDTAQKAGNTWLIRIPSPSMSPTTPLLINVSSNAEHVGKCEITW